MLLNSLCSIFPYAVTNFGSNQFVETLGDLLKLGAYLVYFRFTCIIVQESHGQGFQQITELFSRKLIDCTHIKYYLSYRFVPAFRPKFDSASRLIV
jgi:hypothetical protein